MKECPEDCEDGHLDFCLFCRTMDDRKCEKVCPVDINLVDHGSYDRCTKCFECYIACDQNAIKLNIVGKPDIFHVGGFFKRLGARLRKKKATPMENRSNIAQ